MRNYPETEYRCTCGKGPHRILVFTYWSYMAQNRYSLHCMSYGFNRMSSDLLLFNTLEEILDFYVDTYNPPKAAINNLRNFFAKFAWERLSS